MTNEEIKERIERQIKKIEDLKKAGCIDFFGVLDYHKSILKELEKLEKLEKAIEILRTGAIATPCFSKIRTPMGDFFKMEFAIQKEKDFKFIQEVLENE